MRIEELDTTDVTARHAWYAARERSVRADRPHALTTTLAAFEVTSTSPSTHYARTWLQAVDGEELLGVAELELPLTESLEVAWCEVAVLPEHRRHGVGRALWDAVVDRARAAGRTRLGGEVNVDFAVPGAARAFAAAMGAVEMHREDHLVASLPVQSARVDPAYDVVTWRGRCRDEHRAASEERLIRTYDLRVAAARRRTDGVFGGYSLLLVPHGADYAWQDDTLVMPEHRGHRLGAALKSVNYAGLPDHIGQVHTWTAPTNTAMHHTNTALGFRIVEHLHEVEAVI